MHHIYTTIAGLVFILLTRRIYYRYFEIFICLLIIINFDFFHLVPRIGESDIYREIVLVVISFYLFENFIAGRVINYNENFNSNLGILGKLILFYILIIISGVFISTFKGQPILLGLKAAKWHAVIMIYFIIAIRKFDIKKFFYYFTILSTTLSILIIIQYIIYDKYHFFYFYDDSVDHVRGIGEIRGLRILEGNPLVGIGCLISICFLMKKQSLLWIFTTAILSYVIIFIMQVRSQIIGIFITIIFLYYIANRANFSRLIFGFFLIFFSIFFISISTIFFQHDYFLSTKLVKITIQDFDGVSPFGEFGVLNIRLKCLLSYWDIYTDNWILGRGLLNYGWDGNIDYYLNHKHHLYLIDIGVFHIIVNHGILGLIFLISLFLIIFPRCLMLYNTLPLSAYFLSGFILMPLIDIFFRFDCIILFGIFIGLMDKVDYSTMTADGNKNKFNCDFMRLKSYKI